METSTGTPPNASPSGPDPESPGRAAERHLVTGASGFAGCFLVDALYSRGESVVGLSRRGTWPEGWAHLARRVELRAANLADPDNLVGLLGELRPTRIFHLAGFSHAGQSLRDPEAAWRDNLRAAERLYEAVVKSGLNPRILHVSSGLVYGPPSGDAALDESSPLAPESPYARSKAAGEEVCERFQREHGLAIIRARPFNHTGPTQPSTFAIPSFARQLAAIAAGTKPGILETGNLEIERDLSDVRDVVDAYVRLMERGTPGEVYNIASGHSVPLRRVVEQLIELSNTRVEIRPRPDLFRPGEPACIRVNVDKLRRQTQWLPRFTLEETLADTLAAWKRAEVNGRMQE